MTYFTTPIARSAEALRQVRATSDELTVNLFLCAIERHYGTDHMREAHRLAGEIAQSKMDAEYAAR
jgi:hypothetical protein